MARPTTKHAARGRKLLKPKPARTKSPRDLSKVPFSNMTKAEQTRWIKEHS